MSVRSIAGACLLLAAAAGAPGLSAESADGTELQDGWVSLFNGRNLDGWTVKIRHRPVGDNFASTFRVTDGRLTVGYDGYEDFDDSFGHIFFETPYSHYRLALEYRFIGEQAPGAPDWARRNSGVMLHAQSPQSMPVEQDFPISLEFQFLGGLDDGNPRPTGNMCSPGTHVVYEGRFEETHCIDSESGTYDGDQWVTAEALVLGGSRIVHFINGQPVIEYAGPTYGGGVVSGHLEEMKPDGESLSGGYIALQSEGHPIQFRNIRLRNLRGCTDPDASNYRAHYVVADDGGCVYARE